MCVEQYTRTSLLGWIWPHWTMYMVLHLRYYGMLSRHLALHVVLRKYCDCFNQLGYLSCSSLIAAMSHNYHNLFTTNFPQCTVLSKPCIKCLQLAVVHEL